VGKNKPDKTAFGRKIMPTKFSFSPIIALLATEGANF
jgi:hypothetical protein